MTKRKIQQFDWLMIVLKVSRLLLEGLLILRLLLVKNFRCSMDDRNRLQEVHSLQPLIQCNHYLLKKTTKDSESSSWRKSLNLS